MLLRMNCLILAQLVLAAGTRVRTSEAQGLGSGLRFGALDKLPLLTGKILLDPAEGMPPAPLDILDGKYEGRAPVGKTTVRINSFVKYSLK
jgi:hypothetical protein